MDEDDRLSPFAAVEGEQASLGAVGELVGEDDLGPELARADQRAPQLATASSVEAGWI